MNKEIEIDFVEPTLAIIITSLEEIENELHLKSENKNEQILSDFIDQLNDVEDIEKLEQMLLQLYNMENELLSLIIESKNSSNKFELTCALFSALEASKLLEKNSFLFNHVSEIEEMISLNKINNELDIFENYKNIIINLINELYLKMLNDFEPNYSKSTEFYKVMEIASNELNLNDLREASKLLINIFRIDFDFANLKKMNQLKALIKCEVLINLMDLWSEFELVDDDVWA